MLLSQNLTEYRYYKEGRSIGILANNVELGAFLTPTEDDANVILLRYTEQEAEVSAETDSIGVDDRLGRALVYYVKKRLAEDMGDERKAALYHVRFLEHMYKSTGNKIGSLSRQQIPKGSGVLR